MLMALTCKLAGWESAINIRCDCAASRPSGWDH
jgi:hypothetical protein